MMNSIPVLCFPFLSFHRGKGDHAVIIEVLFTLYFSDHASNFSSLLVDSISHHWDKIPKAAVLN